MKEKRDIQTITSQQINYLDRILDPKDVEEFKKLIPELKDTWHKKQMFRTETEMRFSVLNDAKYPTDAAKYWQAVREQNTHFQNLMRLSFDIRKNDVEIKKIQTKLKTEKDEHEKELLEVELDEKAFNKADMELTAKHRMREVEHWSRLKKELLTRDPNFNTKDVNAHQLHSYGLVFKNKVKTLTPGTSQPEAFNILAQAQTIKRVQKEARAKLRYKQKKQITKKSSSKS
mgnify:CR=1 FL=1